MSSAQAETGGNRCDGVMLRATGSRQLGNGDRGALVTQVGAMRPATERSRFHSVEGRRRARARMLYAVVMLVALVSASFTATAHDDPHCVRKQSPWIA
jgi:hypothetical protein